MYFFCNFNEIRGPYTSSFNEISFQNYIVMGVRILMTFKVYTLSIIDQPIRLQINTKNLALFSLHFFASKKL